MPYSTIDDIAASLPEDEIMRLTDDEGLGVLDTARLDDAIARAGADIDARCGVRYRVPVYPVPELLRKISVDISIYYLYSRLSAEVPSSRARLYQDAMEQLEAISTGLVSLGGPGNPPEAAKASGAGSNMAQGDNVFSRGSMGGY